MPQNRTMVWQRGKNKPSSFFRRTGVLGFAQRCAKKISMKAIALPFQIETKALCRGGDLTGSSLPTAPITAASKMDSSTLWQQRSQEDEVSYSSS